MKNTLFILLVLPFLVAADWLQFRGTENNPVAPNDLVPNRFSGTENVAWKAPLPGDGVSGPIVVKGRVVVTASSGTARQDRLHVLAFDVKDGKQLWHRQLWALGRPFHHPTSANAAPTPASDGEHIFAFYSSNDLVCLDLDGNLLWYRGLGFDYPKAGNDVGMASSPLVVGDTVVVQIESLHDSFAAGLVKATGEERWRISRPKAMNWVSPTALRGKDGKQAVLLQAAKGIAAHDPLTGKELWTFEGSAASIASAMTVDDRMYVPADGLTALKGSPDGSSFKVLWSSNRLGPGNASPVVHDGRIYVLADVLKCGDANTGDVLWQLRLKGSFWATPVIAGGNIYCPNQDGQCLVVKLGEKGEIVHEADLGEPLFASPAVADGAMYLRTEKHLWKIASP